MTERVKSHCLNRQVLKEEYTIRSRLLEFGIFPLSYSERIISSNQSSTLFPNLVMVEPKIRLSWDSCVYWYYVCLMSGTVGFLQSYITPRVIPAWKSGSKTCRR